MNRIKNLMKKRLKSSSHNQIIKICEYEIVSAVIMKKQYQNIFLSNEKEKQKCKRSTCRIAHEEDLTRKETQNLIISSVKTVEQLIIQSLRSAASASASQLQTLS
ncbi:hypothetical protein LOZ66_006796 [Ophidiomyces ophidiicola]|nr:hypothetical protein LOZ66_006796 [Ophidiomyces ophidiicola]